MTADAAPAPLLRVDGLTFSYPGRHVFTHWSADIGPGLTWLRGGNGSGKSTLLKLLAGALQPLAGRLLLNGSVDAAAAPLAYRRGVFWCGPGAIAFDHLRPSEFFAFMQTLYAPGDAAAASAAAALAVHVDAFGLGPHLRQRLSLLSTGTQRKVWIAAALAAGTPLVLLDEPLNALDAASLLHLQAQLQRAADGSTQAFVVASHEAPGPAAANAALLEL